MRFWLGASGPTQAPGGKAGNSAANPFSIPCTRLWHRAPAFFFGPTSPSASSNVKPCTRDQHARIAPAIFRSLRAVCGITCPSPPAMITPASSTLVFSASASSMSGAILIWPAQITSEHQADRAPDFQHHDRCRPATSRITARERCLSPAIARVIRFVSVSNPAAETAAKSSRLSAKCLYGAL